jgi:hypothetical protein
MARPNSGSNKILSTARPVLTGESRIDAELWRLSSVLAEIAEQASQSKNDGDASTEKQMQQRTSNGQAFALIEDSVDV